MLGAEAKRKYIIELFISKIKNERMKSVWEDHMYTRKELMINSKCLPQTTVKNLGCEVVCKSIKWQKGLVMGFKG